MSSTEHLDGLVYRDEDGQYIIAPTIPPRAPHESLLL